jgi:hypothetical protein
MSKRYEVDFVYTTGKSIIVEADSPERAIELATQELLDIGVDRLPEMFPEDFEFVEVNEC